VLSAVKCSTKSSWACWKEHREVEETVRGRKRGKKRVRGRTKHLVTGLQYYV